jgi:hypothetical protein
VDIERKAKLSKSLLENDWFIETIEDLRERQKEAFANSSVDGVHIREEAHAILRALNLIEQTLQSDVDAIKFINKKGQDRGND